MHAPMSQNDHPEPFRVNDTSSVLRQNTHSRRSLSQKLCGVVYVISADIH